MIRNLKYGGRRTIERRRISLTLHDGSPKSVQVSLNLDGLVLPENASARLEAYRKSTLLTFDLGSVKEQGMSKSFQLPGFHDDDIILFRIKILIPNSNPPLLAAEADRLLPIVHQSGGSERTTILHVKPVDLGDEVWKVDFADDFPVLLVNKHIPGILHQTKVGGDFIGLVYPNLVRILLQESLERQAQDDDDSGNWPDLWLKWGAFQIGRSVPSVIADQPDWIELVVTSFAAKVRAEARYRSELLS